MAMAAGGGVAVGKRGVASGVGDASAGDGTGSVGVARTGGCSPGLGVLPHPDCSKFTAMSEIMRIDLRSIGKPPYCES